MCKFSDDVIVIVVTSYVPSIDSIINPNLRLVTNA
jgi:hypothetical protein